MLRNYAVALLAVASLAMRAPAQDLQARVAAMKQNIAANREKIRRYQWIQTTKVSVNGEVKQTQVSSCNFPAGSPKPACTEISSTPAEKPSGGPIKRKIIENKIAAMKAYMDSVKTLMEMYVPVQPEMIEAARAAGHISITPNPQAKATTFAITDYAQQGDKVSLIVSDTTQMLRSATVATWLNEPQHAVTLRITWAKLPDGTRYSATKSLSASKEGIIVNVSSTNYSMAPGAN